jgi:hypothetical protein
MAEELKFIGFVSHVVTPYPSQRLGVGFKHQILSS